MGRLWAACEACGAWNLEPLESRWEALEELERLTAHTGKVLAKTDNIALIQAHDVEIIRIGGTQRREENWWRFGKEAERRSRNAQKVIRRGHWKDAIASLMLIGLPLPFLTSDETWIKRARQKHFGMHAWSGTATCEHCLSVQHAIDFRDALVIAPAPDTSGIVLQAPCWRCAQQDQAGHITIGGEHAHYLLRRVLAYRNYADLPWRTLYDAFTLIESAPSPGDVITQAAARHSELDRMRRVEFIALEIAATEARERELMQLDLRDVERKWRFEEEVAAIIDRELTPP